MTFQSGGPGWIKQVTPLQFSGEKSEPGPKAYSGKKKQQTDEDKFSAQEEIDLELESELDSKNVFRLIIEFFTSIYKNFLLFFAGTKKDTKE